MRDYKNVKVPRTYRTGSSRVTIKRVETGHGLRRPEKSAGTFRSALLKLLIIGVLSGGAWLGWQAYRTVTQAELFQISGVDVKGVRRLDEADIKNIVGVFTGRNIFRADLTAAVKTAKANPWVKTARIQRSLPNRISMVITEREPYAILDTGKGRFLMDDEAVIIERVSPEKAGAWRLPVIAVKDYRAGAGEQVTAEGMGEVLTVLSEIASRGGWQPDAVTIKADSAESLTIVFGDHEFKLGSGNYAEKLRRLAEVMADVKQRGLAIAYVDLRPERQVAVMVMNGRGQGSGSRGKGK
jgi:cell division septal protein FtsQ